MPHAFSLRPAAALLFAVATVGAPAQALSLIGDSITAAYYFPNDTTLYGNFTVSPAATFIVGPGIEATGTVDSFASTDFDFDADSLTMSITANVGYSGGSFNGWQFTNGTKSFGAITSVSGIAASSVAASGSTLSINWAGLSFTDGDRIVINFGVIPEPASWALMIAGFGLIGAAARRRRNTATA